MKYDQRLGKFEGEGNKLKTEKVNCDDRTSSCRYRNGEELLQLRVIFRLLLKFSAVFWGGSARDNLKINHHLSILTQFLLSLKI